MEKTEKVSIWSRNFICIMFTNCLLQMSHSASNTLVSTYATFLGAGPRIMGLLTGMFFGVALAMRPVAGPIQAKVDHRKLMIGVLVIGCIVNLGYAGFHTIPLFVCFRVLHGIQYAFVGSLCITIAADSLPQSRMASGLGVFGVSSAVAQSIAPQLGLTVRAFGMKLGTEDTGYTALFLFSVLCLLLSLVPAILMRPDARPKEQTANKGKWYANIISKNALVPAICMMFLLMAYSIFSNYMVPFGEEKGIGNIGLFYTVFAGLMLATRPISGMLTDKLGLRKLFIPGVILFIASFLIVSSADSLTVVLAGAFVAAFGYGTVNPCIQTLTMQMEPRAKRAVASNTLYVGLDIGLFLGPVLGGFVRDFANYKSVIFAGCVPAALAMVAFLVFWPTASRRQQEVAAMDQ